MSFSSFFSSEPRYIRRIRSYLQEARMAALEHSIAAEHYKASAEMYAERARRLEEELQAYEDNKAMGHAVDVPPASHGTVFSGSNARESLPSSMGVGAPSSVGIVRAA